MWSMVVQPRLDMPDDEPDAGMAQPKFVRARDTRTSAPCWYCVAVFAMDRSPGLRSAAAKRPLRVHVQPTGASD